MAYKMSLCVDTMRARVDVKRCDSAMHALLNADLEYCVKPKVVAGTYNLVSEVVC